MEERVRQLRLAVHRAIDARTVPAPEYQFDEPLALHRIADGALHFLLAPDDRDGINEKVGGEVVGLPGHLRRQERRDFDRGL